MKVLVCDPISQTGIDHLLNQSGIETIILDRTHSEEELLELVKDVSAVAVRSETKITKNYWRVFTTCLFLFLPRGPSGIPIV